MSLKTDSKRAVRPDEALVEGIRRGVEQDFTTLYERYYDRIYNFSFLRLRNHSDTEEVVQETFTAVFRSIDGYRGTSSVLSWIYGIAKNTVNSHIRRNVARDQRQNRAERELVRNHEWSSPNRPDEHLALQRCAESLRDQLASVADWQSEIFKLRHLDNLSIGEIADRTSRSNDAVRSSLCRVKRIVVDAIESGGSTGSLTSMDRGLA